MNRTRVVFFAIGLAFALAACGGSGGLSSGAKAAAPNAEIPATAATPTAVYKMAIANWTDTKWLTRVSNGECMLKVPDLVYVDALHQWKGEVAIEITPTCKHPRFHIEFTPPNVPDNRCIRGCETMRSGGSWIAQDSSGESPPRWENTWEYRERGGFALCRRKVPNDMDIAIYVEDLRARAERCPP